MQTLRTKWIPQFMEQLKKFDDIRIGLIFYRDYNGDYNYRRLPVKQFAFTTDFAKFKKNSAYKNISPSETVEALLKDQTSEGFKLIYEIAEELKTGIKLLEKATGLSIDSMRITGGQTHNNPWNQFKADVLGIKLETTRLLDAELMGDAITAFAGMGIFSSIEEGAETLVKPAKIFDPQTHF